MGTWWVIAGVVAVFLVLGALLALVPERSKQGNRIEPGGRSISWRARVGQRLQRRRLFVLAYLGVIAVATLVIVVWLLPSVLTQHPHLEDPADRHKAIADTRTGLVALLAAIGAVGGLAYTARTYRLSREGQITDRYSKAVEQLGHKNIEVHLGGIYALERLMHDSPADQPTIMETLAAFVRQHAPRPPRPALPAPGASPSVPDPPVEDIHPSEDVQAVLTVLGRRRPLDHEPTIYLPGTNLMGADLTGAILTPADLSGADLTDAGLSRADLTHANLNQATLTRAVLDGATLDGATLTRGSLKDDQLKSARSKNNIDWVGPAALPPPALRRPE